MTDILPTFVIAGEAKCGTTSLAKWLGDHAEVFVAPQKEVHYFDRHFQRGISWYRAQFQEAGVRKVVGEATPGYAYGVLAFDRMVETLPDAKVILMFRNPIDRAYLHYWHNRARGREKDHSFAQAIDAEKGRTTSRDPRQRSVYAYVGIGRYADTLEKVRGRYPTDRVYVVLLDDLKREPIPTFKSVCRFIGVDDSIVPTGTGSTANAYVAFRSETLRNVTHNLPGPIKTVVGRLNVNKASYPKMEPDIQVRLVEMF